MQQAEVIEVYEAILCVTEDMLKAARGGDWDLLVERERACRTLVDWLRQQPQTVQLDQAQRARKSEIIRKVLADDAEIRNLTEPRMARLAAMLEGNRRERQVRAIYGGVD